jgi:iduronate 2-sulfatase
MLTRRSLLTSLPLLAAGGRKNVLFVVADDLNNALGCYGHKIVQTPHLDRFARRAMVFDRAYCQFPLCQPSRASLLSGRRPDTTRVLTLQTPTREYLGDAVFLPELFRKAGYFTAHAGKIYHTGDHAEDPRSWDEETREFGKEAPADKIVKQDKVPGPRGHSFAWSSTSQADEETPDGIFARKTVEYMERAVKAGKPFFLGAGFRRPHSPYSAPQRYFDLYDPARIPLPATPPSHIQKMPPASYNYEPLATPLPDATVRDYLRAYYACVSFMDAQFGVLMQAMDRLQLWDNTIVVFFGDHGYHLGDHGGLWHKQSLYEASARVPLIVYAPGRKGMGRRSERLIELVDLYPTLADLCALPTPPGLEGTSFVPVLDNPTRPWKQAAFTMVGRAATPGPAPREILFTGRAIRTERWRYIEWDDGKRGVELYDCTRDPDELQNLAGQPRHAATQSRLREQLHKGWRAAVPE